VEGVLNSIALVILKCDDDDDDLFACCKMCVKIT